MQLCDINPYIRFAAQTSYISQDNPVKVTDCRIFYVVSGNADLYIENQHYKLKPNTLFYCRGGSEYNIVSPEGFFPLCINFDLTWQHSDYSIHFTPCNQKNQWASMPIFYDRVENSELLSSHHYMEDGSRLYTYIDKIISEFSCNSVFYQEICSTVLKELLIELHRVEQKSLPEKVKRILKYIEENYDKDLSNKELADFVGYHEYHLNRLFLTYTGSNLHNYLLRTRLNRAKYLILNTDMPLKVIPEKIGFNSYSHFSSYFKQTYGVSPSQYRNSLKDNI